MPTSSTIPLHYTPLATTKQTRRQEVTDPDQILSVSSKKIKDSNVKQYTIEFKPPSSPTKFRYTYRGDEELFKFVESLARDFRDLKDVRFIHNNHVITLQETQEDVWNLPEELYMIINDNEYLVDLDNLPNQQGNAYFKKQDFKKAIEKYTVSIKRYPDRLKPLLNRALSYYKAADPSNCIRDCNRFFEKLKELDDSMEDEIKENDLTNKAYFRRARSYFALVKQILDENSSSDDELSSEEHRRVLTFLNMVALDFAHVRKEEFDKQPAAYAEFDIAINTLVINRITPPCCMLCRKITDKNDFASVHVIPKQIEGFFEEEIKKQPKWKMLCNGCANKIEKKEEGFIRKVWNVLYSSPQSFKQEHIIDTEDNCVYSFIASVCWKAMAVHDLRSLNYDERPYSTKKIFSRLRTYLLSEEITKLPTTFVPPKCYLFVSPTQDTILNNYLNRFNMDISQEDYGIGFVHVNFKQIHCNVLVMNDGIEWNDEYKIRPFDRTMKIPKEIDRQWPTPLLEHINIINEEQY